MQVMTVAKRRHDLVEANLSVLIISALIPTVNFYGASANVKEF
jgi:hypothetical protein